MENKKTYQLLRRLSAIPFGHFCEILDLKGSTEEEIKSEVEEHKRRRPDCQYTVQIVEQTNLFDEGILNL
ncbi:MAG: hypothetical protein WBM07_17075 [Chitinivibrionales bacterium]